MIALPDRLEGGVRVPTRTIVVWAALAALLMSMTALAIAPVLMPESYSWSTHTLSESAAQGVDGAWLARLGFTLFGAGVLLLAAMTARDRKYPEATLFALFGLLMLAVATFSHRPWEPEVSFNQTEDLLHSIAATGVGFAFAFSVVLVTLSRRAASISVRAFDLFAIAASVAIPLGMSAFPESTGVFQRAMFLIAYVWFGMEIWRCMSVDSARTAGK